MALNSLQFAAFFLVFLAVLLVIPKRLRKAWLLLGNCIFYLSWERKAFALVLLSSLLIWACGQACVNQDPDAGDAGKKRLFFILPVLWCAGLLLFFKFSGVVGSLFRHAGSTITFRDLAAPLGIAFYTLRCISYMADVFRGTILPSKNPADVLIYVSFFPQIISGPIERPGNFFRELKEFEQKPLRDFDRIRQGFLLFFWGLFQKLVVAERLAAVTAYIFPRFESFGFWEILTASLAYTLQIYCDFSGYSDMSRGIAAMAGFSAMRNFRRPYLAAGIRDFWHRWHISLTSWLTDYVYIPLGGSRKGTLRKYLNIITVFLVSGLWHGSTLNFIFWGLLHAAFQILEDIWTRTGMKLPRFLTRIITLAEVNFAWIFFNSGGLNRGFRIVRQMFSRFRLPSSWELGLAPGNWAVLFGGLIILLIADLLHERGIAIQKQTVALPLPIRWLLMLGLLWAVIMLGIYGVGYDTSSFIYASF